MAPFERFHAWQQAHRLVVMVYQLSARWPSQERYGLTTQARRAAISIPTNIAEGAVKRGPREFRRYLDVSLGSLGELTYLLRLARDLGYLTDTEYQDVENLRALAGRLTWRLYQGMSRAST